VGVELVATGWVVVVVVVGGAGFNNIGILKPENCANAKLAVAAMLPANMSKIRNI
jgi:cell division GTPase FtsZ